MNRWFEVIAERFDWPVRRGLMKSWKHKAIGYGTADCIAYGLKIGAIRVIKRPAGYVVNKNGKVRHVG